MIAWIKRLYYNKKYGRDTVLVEYPEIFKVGHEGSTGDGKPFIVKAKIGDELWVVFIDRPTKTETGQANIERKKKMPCKKGSKGKKRRQGGKKGKKKGR